MRIIRTLGCVTAAVIAVPLLGVAPASAKPIDHSVQNPFEFGFTDEDFCDSGLAVDVHGTGTLVETVRGTASGAPLFFDNIVGTTEFSANGRTVTVDYAGPFRDSGLVDNGDGTITLTSVAGGVLAVVRDADGDVLWEQRGRLVVQTVIDLSGTPSEPEDDVFLSQTETSFTGNVSDGDFCEAVLGGLTA
jgi:hypothetical protein